MVEAIARVRHIRVTPMKARRVVNLIRGKQAQEALAILKFAPQSASEPVYKLVASAIANARVKADQSNTYLDEQDLYVSSAYVDEGTTLKRFQPRAQGRASPQDLPTRCPGTSLPHQQAHQPHHDRPRDAR